MHNIPGEFLETHLPLRHPKDLSQSPVGILRDTPARHRGQQQSAHVVVGFVSLGESYEAPSLATLEHAAGSAEESLLKAVLGAVTAEFYGDLRDQLASPGARGFDVTARDAVTVEAGAHHRLEECRLAGTVRSVKHVETLGQGTNLHAIGKTPPALNLH